MEELKQQISELLHEIIVQNKTIISKGQYDHLLSLCDQDISIISCLAQKECQTAKEISQSLNAPKTTIVSAVARLVKRGYIEREVNLADKREQLLKLTKKGIQTEKEHLNYEETFVSYMCSRFSKEDQMLLNDILRRRK